MTGKFIVIDGVDGSGKGTQAKLLANYLFERDKRHHVFLTREPYNSKYYLAIRKILKENKKPSQKAEILTKLFVEDRKIHAKIIEKLLRRGIWVISDRYKYSTLACQQTQGMPLKKLLQLHKGILVPDLTLVLDIPIKTALKRIAKNNKRSHREVFEEKSFQEKLRKNFLSLVRQLPKEKIMIMDGGKPIAKVFEKIKKAVEKIF
jgi:dTMP kinase